MATRNVIMVVPQKYGFNEDGLMTILDPADVSEFSYLNMYMHHDGYPEWQGVQLANWRLVNTSMDTARIAAKLAHDHYYDSSYLYPSVDSCDHQYTYIVWVGEENNKITCFDRYKSKHVFTMTPNQIKTKYEDNKMEYTDFANGEKRLMKADDPNFNPHLKTVDQYKEGEMARLKYHAKRIIDMLTNED